MKVAIVHYWLVNMRGGEKVLEALLDMFPQADIYTHVYVPEAISEKIRSHRVFTTKISKLPMAAKFYQKYMPLMPDALKELDLSGYDLIISSESGPAKGVVPNPDAFHLCYCHSPMRYLWDMYHEYFRTASGFVRFFMKKLVPSLRLWDVMSANLVDCFVANSHYVAKRINRYYNRPAEIVYPPVAIEKFATIQRNPKDYYLFFGQLVGYKRADLALEACVRSGRKLVVVGEGGSPQVRKKYEASGLVSFAGRVTHQQLEEYMGGAKALLFPGVEDFGIIPVEANAAGCPVIAYRKGGAIDSIKEGVTGIFFDQQTPESLIQAMTRFEALPPETFADRSKFAAHVAQFSQAAFTAKIQRLVDERKRR